MVAQERGDEMMFDSLGSVITASGLRVAMEDVTRWLHFDHIRDYLVALDREGKDVLRRM